MAVPSKAAQIAAVVDLLDDDTDKSLTDIATEIINGMYSMWSVDLADIPMPLHVGRKFKVPWTSTIHQVSWMGECKYHRNGVVRDCVWITDSGSGFGSLAPADAEMWRVTLPTASKAEPKENALGIKPGHVYRLGQGSRYTVKAVSEKAVLFESPLDALRLYADSNAAIEKSYKRES